MTVFDKMTRFFRDQFKVRAYFVKDIHSKQNKNKNIPDLRGWKPLLIPFA